LPLFFPSSIAAKDKVLKDSKVIFPVPSGSAIFLAFSFSSSVGSLSGLGKLSSFAVDSKACFSAS
jgi:hypothetical protein